MLLPLLAVCRGKMLQLCKVGQAKCPSAHYWWASKGTEQYTVNKNSSDKILKIDNCPVFHHPYLHILVVPD
uniref:HDC03891 n=1 Tax=Drosophila melanogaster TaxID=7227 RepID=Q6IH07_DROME|nr:TPA_inf: HDC03891 [Drosophila melanogaster]